MDEQSVTGPFLYDPSDLSCSRVVVGKVRLSLADFLVYCANSIGEQYSPLSENKELTSLRYTFLDGGLSALKTTACPLNWIQIGLEIGRGVPHMEIYRRVSRIARELLDNSLVSNFFFMHKPPGLRVRFETTGTGRSEIEEDLYQRLAVWQSEGLIERAVPGVYEPESHLFGGPVSMQSVHQLFTIDSLAWLDFHSLSTSDEGEEPVMAWELSFVMLGALFTALRITAWEDLDVWDRIRRKTGRHLSDEALSQAGPKLMAEIRSIWFCHENLLDGLSPLVQGIAQNYQQAIEPVIVRWCGEYFATRQAYIGPREATAFFTIFHWNRAALSLERQALLTEALAVREPD